MDSKKSSLTGWRQVKEFGFFNADQAGSILAEWTLVPGERLGASAKWNNLRRMKCIRGSHEAGLIGRVDVEYEPLKSQRQGRGIG
jgi:hypothetical protein